MTWNGCDHNCEQCAFPDCIAPEDDLTEEEIARGDALDAAAIADRQEEEALNRYSGSRSAYYAANRDVLCQKSRAWYAENKSAALERMRRYAMTDRAKLLRRASEARRRAEDPERYLEKQRAYRLRKKQKRGESEQ